MEIMIFQIQMSVLIAGKGLRGEYHGVTN